MVFIFILFFIFIVFIFFIEILFVFIILVFNIDPGALPRRWRRGFLLLNIFQGVLEFLFLGR